MSITAAVFCMAQAIYFEARGEELAHRLMVANTIMNRVKSPRYPDTVCEVVKQRHQFSYYWDGKPETIDDRRAWNDALYWAERYLENPIQFHEGCHYAHKDLNPRWASAMEASFVAGNHRFYIGGCD